MSVCSWNHEEPCIIVTVGGVEAVSSGAQPGHGLVSLDGWEGGAPATGGPVAFEAADGGVPGDVYYGPRTLIIEGDTFAESHEDLAERIAELTSLGRYETLTVDETVHLGVVRQVEVARLRPVQITMHGPTFASWTMTLQTVDWRRMGVDMQSATVTAAGAVLQNNGTAPAPVFARLIGPLSNPGLSWPGGTWAYSGSIPTGTTITVDMGTRVVRNPATTEHSRHRAAGSWLSLPPGETVVTRTGTGSGRVEVEWRSAWS